MERTPGAQHSPNTLLSRILQVALGLFVTTSDLPSLPANHEMLSYDCSFDSDCRWASIGGTMDHWRVARGEPDSLLWLAATGTMQLPREPFVLIEQRGAPVDALMTDLIRCQKGYADFSFIYWAIGSADLEICLTDQKGEKFNCTGNLDSRVMPGKVSLKIPEMQKPFRIMISPNNLPGVLVIDDIRYDASTCEHPFPIGVRGRPDVMSTVKPIVLPWTMRKVVTPEHTTTEEPITEAPTTTTKAITTTPTTTTTEPPTTTEEITTTRATLARTFSPLPSIISEKSGITPLLPATTTDIPFDIMIHGNKTTPLFDRRTGMIITESTKLLCGFNDEFACQWGAEAGRWAVVQKGAIPSLDDSMADSSLLPTYPAALVIQGAAMLTSDPIRCQTGPGKVLFRYWSNGDILLQVCALGYGIDSHVIECVDQSRSNRHDSHNLAVFDISRSIRESFTLNIVPQWETGLKNRFLVIDEIAYIGECNPDHSRGRPATPMPVPTRTTERPTTTTTTEEPTTTTEEITTTTEEVTTTTEEDVIIEEEVEPPTPGPWLPITSRPPPKLITLPGKPFTKEIYTKKKTFPPRTILTTQRTVFPGEYTSTKRPTHRWTIPTRSTTPEPKQDDYCDLLNCNFDDNACNYLNHGLTKKPWTLRNRGYGYPLTGNSDIRPTSSNGQFVSSILDPGDIAILESPKFNSTRSLNVLLFQYYRPSQMTTIRLCLVLPGCSYSDRAETRAAMAIDNMRVAICDARGFAPDYMEDIVDPQTTENTQNFQEYDNLA